MKEKQTNILSIQASVSKGWLYDKWGFTFTEEYYMQPLKRRGQDKEMHERIVQYFPDHPIYNMEDNLVQSRFVTNNQILVGGIQPNLIIAEILGGKFKFFPDKDSDIEGNPLNKIQTIYELPSIEKILNHPFIQSLDKQIETVKADDPELKTVPPFFWDISGRATIHGIITTSFKLIGENAMMMSLHNPELLHQIHKWLTDVYIALINHFSAIGNIPVTSIHVGECSGAMLSEDVYNEFVVPYISRLGNEFGSVRLHSCGKSDHILNAISKIENLRIIDTGSGTSVLKIRELMGRDFEINLFPPVELLMKGSPKQKIINWLDLTLAENQNGPIRFAYHLESGYGIESCMALHDELEKYGLRKERLY